MKEKQILLAGYYGAGNLGDDAILISIIDAINRVRSDVLFTVASFDPQKTKKELELNAVYWRDIPALAQAILQADMVIIGGGGLFMDYWGLDENSYFRSIHGGISTYGTPALLAELFDIPWMFYGVGVGPLFSDTAIKHTALLFSKAPIATLRDKTSLDLLQKIGLDPLPGNIHLTADPAFALTTTPEETLFVQKRFQQMGIDPNKPLLGVSLRYWDRSQQPAEWISQVIQGLREFLLQLPMQVIFLPFQSGNEELTDDLSICRKILRGVNLTESTYLLEDRLSPTEMQAMIGQCDMLLGMRLHSLLMGINEGIPIVSLAYDPKVQSLMEEGGMSEWICLMPFDAQTLTNILTRAWNKRNEFTDIVNGYRDAKFSLAMKNAILAVHLLDTAPKEQIPQKTIDFLMDRFSQIQYMDNQPDLLNEELKRKTDEQNYRIQIMEMELNEALSQAALARQRLSEIESSKTYRLALLFQTVRNRIFPTGSSREKWLSRFLK